MEARIPGKSELRMIISFLKRWHDVAGVEQNNQMLGEVAKLHLRRAHRLSAHGARFRYAEMCAYDGDVDICDLVGLTYARKVEIAFIL